MKDSHILKSLQKRSLKMNRTNIVGIICDKTEPTKFGLK